MIIRSGYVGGIYLKRLKIKFRFKLRGVSVNRFKMKKKISWLNHNLCVI